jgi:hypothetical protein
MRAGVRPVAESIGNATRVCCCNSTRRRHPSRAESVIFTPCAPDSRNSAGVGGEIGGRSCYPLTGQKNVNRKTDEAHKTDLEKLVRAMPPVAEQSLAWRRTIQGSHSAPPSKGLTYDNITFCNKYLSTALHYHSLTLFGTLPEREKPLNSFESPSKTLRGPFEGAPRHDASTTPSRQQEPLHSTKQVAEAVVEAASTEPLRTRGQVCLSLRPGIRRPSPGKTHR